MNGPIKGGDYTGLATDYAENRPGYSPLVRDGILGVLGKKPENIDFLDIGAGTGIWTRTLAVSGCRTTGIEPNDDMRSEAENSNIDLGIVWRSGSAEDTRLEDASFDLVTMASSFHWPDFDKATKEIHRVLRPGGWFSALWNPRYIEANPLLVEIENYLLQLIPDLKRVSSGHSEFCNSLPLTLPATGLFDEVLHLEAMHVEEMTPERYVGAWRSVNDIQKQAGIDRFRKFLKYLEERLEGVDVIEASYLTRCWMSRRVGCS